MKISKPNRRSARRPRRGLHWCWGCDMSLVSRGGKCKVCGKKDLPRRDKK